MKITVRTQQYAIILTCVYIGLFILSWALRMLPVFINSPLGILYSLIVQINYILLFIYLGLFLAANSQPRLAIIAFALYVTINILSIVTQFLDDFNDLRTYSLVLGLITFVVAIFFTYQIFRLKHPIIAKYYKILAIIMIALAFMHVALPFVLVYMGNYFNMNLYSMSNYYTSIFSLLVPVAIIILLKRTTPLLSDYTEPLQPDEEYL